MTEIQSFLYEKAKKAAEQSYSPYSNFKVGCCVLMSDGDTYIGTNVENASYGLAICGERVAIVNAISSGNKNVVAIAIYAPVESAPPCGACRQFIIEFGDDIDVIFRFEGEIIVKKIAELLPYKFVF